MLENECSVHFLVDFVVALGSFTGDNITLVSVLSLVLDFSYFFSEYRKDNGGGGGWGRERSKSLGSCGEIK